MEHEQFESLYPERSRFSEIEHLLGYVKKGSSCQLIGFPGTGRATLLELLAYNKKIRAAHLGKEATNYHFVLINFSEIRNRSLFDAMKFMFLGLTESLRERGMREEHKVVGDKFREHLSFHDELVLFQGFKEAVSYLGFQRNITTIFLCDRFEEYVPTVTSEFFTNMRILRGHAKYHFSLIFSLNRSLESLLDPALLADYYEFVAGHIVPLQLYDEVSTTFRISYIEKVSGKKLPKGSFEQIITLTGGHGKLTKLSAEAILAQGMPQDLQAFLLEQKTIRGALLEIWRSLSPAEQDDVMHNDFSDPESVSYLEEVGLIAEKTVTIPLLSSFIHQRYGEKGREPRAIVYDEHTNTIKKGSVILSDRLTSSEFRLLRYLLQHADRIVERDELISVVWADVKSTAGITDQAVDQLVFRVRKKIEENPTSPQHLQTVKGRGFRFVG